MAKGSLTVITGPMFSNKSGELIRLATVHRIAGRKVGLFKHSLDDRYEGLEHISTHGGQSAEAEPVGSSATIGLVASSYEVIAVDEVQFFDAGIVDVCMQLADAGIRVIAAGLDQDFKRQPFGPMPALLSVAEEVSKMHAVCVRCRSAAHYSQRVSGGNAQVEVGDSSYEARCRACFEEYSGEPAEEPAVQLTIPV